MPYRVMLVDDSAVIRGLISRALKADPEIVIVATAGNGQMAIESAKAYKPDVIILDIEMPVMDGITALPKLLEVLPCVQIIMASTLTHRNADISLKALELGAVDYLPKPSSTGERGELEIFYHDLLAKVKALAMAKRECEKKKTAIVAGAVAPTVAPAVLTLDTRPLNSHIKAVAIASSTGGPQALQAVFTGIKGALGQVPIFITQHMPPTFTAILAENLSKNGARPCMEGTDDKDVVAGEAYIAPGGFHMVAERKAGVGIRLGINQKPPENFCRPAADPMLRSLADIYGMNLLVVVLTGMGQDGMLGAEYVVSKGGFVIAQNEASSVVYGMPKAVADKKICTQVLALQDIPTYLKKVVI